MKQYIYFESKIAAHKIASMVAWSSTKQNLIFLCMQASENGILSFGNPFFNPRPQPFGTFFSFPSLMVPFWNDADFIRFGILFHRVATDLNTLQRASNLTNSLFPNAGFEAEQVVVVTWYQVARRDFSGGNEVKKYM